MSGTGADWGITTSSLLILVVAVGHVFMPLYGYEPSVVAGLPPRVADHFYYLGTWAICSFLFFVAAISFLMSWPAGRMRDAQGLRLRFGLLSVGLWGVRLLLELVYPVDLNIYFLDHPHRSLTVVLSLILLGYLCDVFSLLRQRTDETWVPFS